MRRISFKQMILVLMGVFVALLCFSPLFYDSASAETITKTSYTATLPTKFSLYTFNGYTGESTCYKPNVGYQGSTDLCWAFASNTALESTLYKSGVTTTLNFSEVDIAYYAYNSRKEESLGGGSFSLAYEYYSSENGPLNEQWWEASGLNSALNWNSNNALYTSYKNALQTYSKDYSPYTALESISFPSRHDLETIDTSSETTTKVANLHNSIKQHIYNNGAVTSSINIRDYSQTSNVVFSSLVGSNHLVALVGWDDNFSYSGHTGAYIAQNSYGTTWNGNGGYIYIMYDDANVENQVDGFVRVGTKVSNKNTYSSTSASSYKDRFITLSNGYVSTGFSLINQTTVFANIFKTTDSTQQVVRQIKIPTTAINYTLNNLNNDACKFEVYLVPLTSDESKDLTASLKNKFSSATQLKDLDGNYQFVAQQTGYYTINVNNPDITLDSVNTPYFIVYLKQYNGTTLFINNNGKVVEKGGTVTQAREQEISLPTYVSSASGENWEEYYGITQETDSTTGTTTTTTKYCVLPMIVSTVAKEKIVYTIGTTSFEYDGKTHLPNIVVSTEGVRVEYSLDNVNFYDTLNIKDVKRDNNGNVASYTIYIRISGDIYSTVCFACPLTINPKTLTITPNALSKVYGNAEPLLTATISGYVSGEDDYGTSGVLSRDAGKNVGSYQIKQGNFTLLDGSKFKLANYSVKFDSTVNFTISKKELIVVPTATSKIYGESEPAFTFYFANTVSGERPNHNIVLSRVEGENAGSYNFSISGGGLLDNGTFIASNYTFSLDTTKTFTITQRELVVTPNANQTKIYGASEPTLTFVCTDSRTGQDLTNGFTIEGILNGQVPAFSGNLSRESGEYAGEYNITITSPTTSQPTLVLKDNGTFLASNYKIKFTSGVKFSISRGTISGITFENKTFDYDGQGHSLTYTSSNKNLTVAYAYSLDNITYTNCDSNPTFVDCGVYYVKATFSKTNYYDSPYSATLEITKATITVSIDSGKYTSIYGNNLDVPYSVSGVQNGETASFEGYFKAENPNVGDTPTTIGQGTFSLCDGENFKAKNYNLVFTSNENAKLSITKRTLTVVPDVNQSKVYGTAKTLTYTLDGVVSSDLNAIALEGSLSWGSNNNVGTYEIVQGSLTLKKTSSISSNYNLVVESGKYFKITPSPLTIKLDDITKNYGEGVNLTTTYKVKSGTIYNPDDLYLTFSCLDDNNSPISSTTRRKEGGYELTAKAGNTNYSVTVISARYFIQYCNFNVQFVINSSTSSKTIEQLSKVGSLPQGLSTNLEGYNFLGWRINEGNNLYSTDQILSQEITSNTTFTAQFSPIEYNIYFVDGEKKQLTTYTIERQVDLASTSILSLVAKIGYDFLGFYETSDFSGEELTQISAGEVGDKILYAKYEKQTYSVSVATFENSTYAHIVWGESVKFGDDYNFSVVLDREYNKSYNNLVANIAYENGTTTALKQIVNGGAQFVVKNVQGTFSISLSGIELNNYTISFVVDGQTLSTCTKIDGATLSTSEYPTIPTKEHFDKSKWDKTEDVVVKEDIVVNAIYTPNTYTVTFVMDGKEYDVDVVYGTKVDTSVLSQNHELGVFEYFKYSKSIDAVSQDETIEVTVGSNIFILYIILGIIAVSIVGVVILNIARQQRRKKFAWWVFGK